MNISLTDEYFIETMQTMKKNNLEDFWNNISKIYIRSNRKGAREKAYYNAK